MLLKSLGTLYFQRKIRWPRTPQDWRRSSFIAARAPAVSSVSCLHRVSNATRLAPWSTTFRRPSSTKRGRILGEAFTLLWPHVGADGNTGRSKLFCYRACTFKLWSPGRCLWDFGGWLPNCVPLICLREYCILLWVSKEKIRRSQGTSCSSMS